MKQLTIYLILISSVFVSSCNKNNAQSKIPNVYIDTTKSFKINSYWATPKLEFDFNSVGKSSGDTLHLVTCSEYGYFPFGLIKNKSDLKTSLLEMFTISKCKREAYMNLDISKDSLWNEYIELKWGRNKLNLFLDNDPEETIHSYITGGEIFDKDVHLINNIKIGMTINEFYKSFFEYFPAELENNYKVIKFESCVTSIIHIYTFNNGKLSLIKFVK